MKIEWRPMYDGMELAIVGNIEIGRVKFSYEPGWICHLPNDKGNAVRFWRRSKNQMTARNELLAHFLDWTRQFGLGEVVA